MLSRRALAPVAACGEDTEPGLAPNGSLNQQPPSGRMAKPELSILEAIGSALKNADDVRNEPFEARSIRLWSTLRTMGKDEYLPDGSSADRLPLSGAGQMPLHLSLDCGPIAALLASCSPFVGWQQTGDRGLCREVSA